MSYLFMILAMPLLSVTGVHNPQVSHHHGHCMAEPGTYRALYCPAPAAPAHHPRHAKR
jgi:hypothetical protein